MDTTHWHTLETRSFESDWADCSEMSQFGFPENATGALPSTKRAKLGEKTVAILVIMKMKSDLISSELDFSWISL